MRSPSTMMESWRLYSVWAPCVPSIFAVILILFISTLQFIAWQLGHLTVMIPVKQNGSNTPQLHKMTFPMAPISLTGNHPPEYFLYAFGSIAIGMAIVVYLLTYRRIAYSELNNLYESFQPRPVGMSPSSFSNHPDQSSLQTNETPVRHQVAFWRSHFRAAGSLESEIQEASSPSISGEEVPLMKKRCHTARYLSVITWITVCAIVCFVGQAVVPAQPDTLYLVSKQCRRVSDVASGDTLWKQDDGRADTEDKAARRMEGLLPRALDWSQDGSLPLLILEDELIEPDTRLLSAKLQDRIKAFFKTFSAFDPANLQTEEPPEFGIDPSLIVCGRTWDWQPLWYTWIHCLFALAFFFLIYSAELLLTLVILVKVLRRFGCRATNTPPLFNPSATSLILKVFFLTLAAVKPLKWFEADLQRHMSLVDTSGLGQRLAVFCVLLFFATLGIDMERLRQGMINERQRLTIASLMTSLAS